MLEQKPCKVSWCVALADKKTDKCVIHQRYGVPMFSPSMLPTNKEKDKDPHGKQSSS